MNSLKAVVSNHNGGILQLYHSDRSAGRNLHNSIFVLACMSLSGI
ncbi:hypothetical protein [Peribacillus frigoritolerans]|nr:hypothetical protein [Peribacillus frigoritolerans]